MAQTYRRCALIGTGLVGGSLLLALRKAGRVTGVVGWDRDPRALTGARAAGILDEAAASAREAAAGADLVILAVPVRATAEVCDELAPALAAAPEVLVTDVGSTKALVLEAVERALPFPARFVGGHPIAGTERSGPEAARPDLFEGRRCLLTPTAGTSPEALAACRALWESVGAEVSIVDAALHDRALAQVSHLPHAVAFALAAAVGAAADADRAAAPEVARLIAGLWGGGFVDTTRIAASDPVMWRDVFLANREGLLAALAGFEDALGALRRAVAAGDGEGITRAIEAARAGRRRVLGERGK